MYVVQDGKFFRLGMLVKMDMFVTGVRGLERTAVKTQLGVMVYLAVPQSHQEEGDFHGAPSGMHVVGVCVDVVLAAAWEDESGCPTGERISTVGGLTGTVDVEVVLNPLDDVSSQVLGPSLVAWVMPQPEAKPPAPMTGTQLTESPVVGS